MKQNFLTLEDFRKLFQSIDQEVKEIEIVQVFKYFDIDTSGEISLDEFKKVQ